MKNPLNALQNNNLAQISQNAPKAVLSAIKNASAKTGVNFSYLVEKAAAESNFDANAKAKTSSATGLFQFIESTWIDMIDKHGDKHGVSPDQDRESLLNLRKDPEIASLMAAEFAEGNKRHLESTVGGDIGNTELYFAHFMGAGGASAFLSQLEKNPLATGADLFPAAAKANRGVFYDSNSGQPKTLQEIYSFFDKKFSSGNDTQVVESPLRKNNLLQATEKRGYQHMPPSLKQPTEIIESKSQQALNSLYKLEQQIAQNQLGGFFTSHAKIFPPSMYGNLSGSNSLMMSLFDK